VRGEGGRGGSSKSGYNNARIFRKNARIDFPAGRRLKVAAAKSDGTRGLSRAPSSAIPSILLSLPAMRAIYL